MINYHKDKKKKNIRKCKDDYDSLISGSYFNILQLNCRRKDRPLVEERQRLALALRAKGGYSYTVIAAAMNRDHSSIQHLCKYRK